MSWRLGVFQIERPIDHGSTGQIWFGRHRIVGTPIAIKALRQHHVGAQMWAQLRAEASAIAGLDHEAIIAVHDLLVADSYGTPDALAERLCMVMEFARHGSLAPLRGHINWQHLAPLLRQVLRGLAHVHARGLLHLDLKPQNILLHSTQDQLQVWISDFGIGQSMETLSPPPSMAGTPGYMAPEQSAHQTYAMGPWTDLYALGATALELLVGKRGVDLDAYPVPGPPDLKQWLKCCLHPEPHQRFASAAKARHALEQIPGALGPPPTWASFAHYLPTDASDAPPPNPSDALTSTQPVVQPLQLHPPTAQKTHSVLHTVALPHTTSIPLDHARQRLVFPGAGLHQAREPALQGRTALRQELWSYLPTPSSGTSALWLFGDAGVGKRRLARWLTYQSEEQGHARGLVLERHAGQHESAALGHLVARLLRCTTLSGDALHIRSSTMLDRLGHTNPYLNATLLNLMEHRTHEVNALFIRPKQARESVWSLLHKICTQQPLLLQLDLTVRLQEPQPALHNFVSWTLNHHKQPPLLWVLSCRQKPNTQDHTCHIPPLSPSDTHALIQRRLGVHSTLAQSLANRSQGNPRFAVLLLQDWIERKALHPDVQGLTLKDNIFPPLPDDLYAMWRQRIETLLTPYPPDARDALFLAACLDPITDPHIFEHACTLHGCTLPKALQEHLVRTNLRSAQHHRFTQPALREALVQMAQEAQLHTQLHRICAQSLHHQNNPLQFAERAHHYLHADMPEEALQTLQLYVQGDNDPEKLLLLLAQCHSKNLSNTDQLLLKTLQASALFRTGKSAQALEIAKDIPLHTRTTQSAAFDLVRFQGVAALSRGQYDAAEHHLHILKTLLNLTQNPTRHLQYHLEAARHQLIYHHNPHAAVDILDRALRDHPNAETTQRLMAKCLLGNALSEAGLSTRSIQCNTEGAASAKHLGLRMLSHMFLNHLADTQRLQGQLQQARQTYRRALDAISHPITLTAYTHINLANLDTEEEKFADARKRLEALTPHLGHDRKMRVWLVLLGVLQVCYAADVEVNRWEDALHELTQALQDQGSLDRELPALLQRAADLWRTHQHPTLAEKAESLIASLSHS